MTHGLGDYVLDSRSFCIAKLMGAGFGPPHECWCPSDSSQDLYLDVHHNKVRVHTETESLDFTSNSSGTFVDLVNT